jgi:hypothetical protein
MSAKEKAKNEYNRGRIYHTKTLGIDDWEVIISYKIDGVLNCSLTAKDQLKKDCIEEAKKRFTKIVKL